MPDIRPGRVHYVTAATKAVLHGAPAIEDGFAGVAIKQIAAPGGTGLGSSLITTVQVGEAFVIEHKGMVYVTNANAQASTFAKGDPVYIQNADNQLSNTSNAGANPKYGRVDAIAGERGIGTGKMRVDLDSRDTF